MTAVAGATKVCTKCGLEIRVEGFHRRARSRDGLMSQCKDCVNERIRANYRKDPAKKIKATRRYHLENPEWSKKTLREWHQSNKDRRLEQIQERRRTDADFVERARSATARAERKRRAAKASVTADTISKEQYAARLEEFGGLCYICEEVPEPLHWDHFQPLSQQGPHTIENLRPACGPCNTRKHSIWPFTDEIKNQIAEEVRALRASQGGALPVTDGKEV